MITIPEFTLNLKVPTIPGQDTKRLDKMPWQMKNQRKALHITSDANMLSICRTCGRSKKIGI